MFVSSLFCTYLLSVFGTTICCAVQIKDNADYQILLHMIEGLQEKMADLQKKNDANQLKVLSLEAVIEGQQAIIEQLQHSVRDPKLQDSNSKRLIIGSDLPVAFSARIDPMAITHVNPGDVIPFNTVLTNYGTGYNSNSSVFVAPMGGIYLIAASLMDHLARRDGTGVMLHANIMKNGAAISRVFAHAEGSSYRDQGAQTIIVELQVGDRVWVSNWNSPDLDVGGEMYSSFSGYLLWPLE